MSEKKKQLIISISREYGAGGHLIAQILAEKLGLELVDADSIARYFADNHNFNYDEVMKYSGMPFNRIIHRTIQGHISTLEENLSRMQFDYLREKAANGDSFVIVGRCSETVLEDYDCMIAFFILADEEDKVKRVMEREGLNEYDARHTARAGTWNHKSYHNYYCKGKWGDSRLYDVCINSSRFGPEKTADILKNYINEYLNS